MLGILCNLQIVIRIPPLYNRKVGRWNESSIVVTWELRCSSCADLFVLLIYGQQA
jgi:hypothetical protein